jgi:FkbM family methyltransferase
VIVDGGANAGFFTVPVGNRTRGRDITIYSFEPQRQIFQGLAGSLAVNDLDHVRLYNMALGDQSGFVGMPDVNYSEPKDFGTVQIESDPVETRNLVDPKQAEIITLDSLDLPRLDFLKLDVEGFETAAIRGGLESIKKYRPWIWVEYFITGFDRIKSCLDGVDDYEFHVMDYQNMLCVPVERAQAQGIVVNK